MAEPSILDSVKKLIGIPAEDTTFDMDIIIHINTVFMVLNQLGIGVDAGYSISDKDALWSAFLTPGPLLNGVKSYMVFRVKAMFDPSSTSFTQEHFKRQSEEMEWRLVIQKETYPTPVLPPLI